LRLAGDISQPRITDSSMLGQSAAASVIIS
jgi:hypothetical protein